MCKTQKARAGIFRKKQELSSAGVIRGDTPLANRKRLFEGDSEMAGSGKTLIVFNNSWTTLEDV